VQTWWNERERSNILFLHFNDLLADLEGEILRVSDYLGIECKGKSLSAIAKIVTFKSMKRD